jgi:leader peptidase (prepilin peptidase)/N-methyltransferase
VSPVTVVLASGVALVGGAVLPLPVYRLSVPADQPHRPACAGCGHAFGTGVGGWLRRPAWRVRCAGCGVPLGPPAWATAAAAAGAAGVLAAALGVSPALPLYVALAVLAVALAAVDLACRRLPHVLVVPATWVAAAGLAVVAAVTGHWSAWTHAVLGAAVLGAAYLALFLLPGQGLGYGDVKLAVLLGLFLGWLGWTEVLLGAVLPWLVNAPVVLTMLARGRVGRKSALPFGPAMVVGALLAVVWGAWPGMVGRL